MAEIVGVIASGISIGTLAVQISSSIIKLKDYFSQIKAAPEDLRLLIEEIEDLHLLLCDIENDRAQNPMSSALLDQVSAARCIERCKRGADRLKELVGDLEHDINCRSGLKRKWASTKAVLEKTKIDRYKSRLESAVRSLSLAYQCYTRICRALIQQQPDRITTRLTEILISMQNPAKHPFVGRPNADSSTSSTMTFGKQQSFEVETHTSVLSSHSETEDYLRRSRRRKQATATLCFKARLLSRAWTIQCLNNASGWQIQIRTYTFRSPDSPIFQFVSTGNLKGVQELFGKGLASPNDIDECYRFSLIELAAAGGGLDICRFLLEQGADLNLTAVSPYRAMRLLTEYGLSHNRSPEAAVHGILMLRHDREITTSMLGCFRGSIDSFALLHQEMDVPYYSLPIEDRVEVSLDLTRYGLENDPQLIRTALGPGPIPAEAIKHKTKDGKTLLHGVAQALGENMCPGFRNTSNLPSWRNLAMESVGGGADLHSLWDIGEEDRHVYLTPLLCLFEGLSDSRYYWPKEFLPQSPQALLETWLEALQSSGVELLNYGRKEAKINANKSMQRKFRLSLRRGDKYHDYFGISPGYYVDDDLELDGFTYGGSVADWKIPECDVAAAWSRDFWWMIESEMAIAGTSTSEMTMPGAWVF